MRRIAASAVAVAAALLLQLSLINRLQLPGGGTPDLVLVLVVALALAGGPMAGMTAGFIAGLCLDLAAPAGQLIGEYALVFCLVGWACGRLRGTVARSALLPIVIAAVAAAVGELLAAVLAMVLDPAQVTPAAVRQVLPATMIYDMAISPFVLYLVLLASAWLSSPAGAARPAGARLMARAAASDGALASGQAHPGGTGLAGSPALLGLSGWLAGPPASRRARKEAARHGPRLGRGSARPGDGWVGGAPASRLAPGTARRPGRVPRLHPAAGVAGSAVPGRVRRSLPARPVNLKLAAGRRGRAAAASGHRSGARGSGAGRPAGAGRASSLAARPIDLRLRSSRRRGGVVGGGLLTAGVASRRQRARPKFRMHPGQPHRAALGDSAAGGVIDQQSFRAIRRRKARAPRLRLGSARRRDGVLGSPLAARPLTRTSVARSPAAPRFRSRPLAGSQRPAGKRPRFGYRRRPLLSWWSRRRGGRAGVWRIASKRTGGPR